MLRLLGRGRQGAWLHGDSRHDRVERQPGLPAQCLAGPALWQVWAGGGCAASLGSIDQSKDNQGCRVTRHSKTQAFSGHETQLLG